jgi:hypothetical protein
MPVSFAIAAPARRLGGDERGEILRRSDARFGIQAHQAGLRLLGLEDVVDRDVELVDDRHRRPRRRKQPRPERSHELGISALERGRHVRQQG